MSTVSCVVIIPVHKADPSYYEIISFKQCFKILGNHPIKILAPENLDLTKYREYIREFDVVNINPFWQSSLLNYNKLKTSRFFYQLFHQYDYLLTYELDAFVFKDELELWCKKGYDYIGAPWFENFDDPVSDKIVGVGNSGFSLRNIQTINKILKTFYYRSPQEYKVGKRKRLLAYLKSPVRWLFNQGKENYTIQKFCKINEDVFFSYIIPEIIKTYKVAPVNEAIKFSFELKPKFLYQKNGNNLPMGCHAWWRYELAFWKPHIEAFGYSLQKKSDYIGLKDAN